jgi:hypothetical protein
VAIPRASVPSEYHAVQVTVQMPGDAWFTVDGLHDALVTTEFSSSTRPGRDFCASAAMHLPVVHGPLGLGAATAEAGAGGAVSIVTFPDGWPDGESPELAHPARVRAAMAAAVIKACVRLVMA